MKKIFLSAFLMLFLACANAQKTDSLHTIDTTKGIPESWKKFGAGVRLGVGIQKSFFYEAGFALQRFVFSNHHGFQAYTFFAAYERSQSRSGMPAVNGVKIGYEIVNVGSAGGIDLRYLWNNKNSDWVITPKIGLGIGLVNILYGYNISTNKRPFESIGRHQFTFVVNTNTIFHYLKKEYK